jgi:hypothetical protein
VQAARGEGEIEGATQIRPPQSEQLYRAPKRMYRDTWNQANFLCIDGQSSQDLLTVKMRFGDHFEELGIDKGYFKEMTLRCRLIILVMTGTHVCGGGEGGAV